jgi:MMP 1-O-methyltransferase
MAPGDVLSQRELAEILRGVDGWLHPAEALELYNTARTHPGRGGDPVVVEIGSWMGRSTISLARGLIDRGSTATVMAIDPAIVTEGSTPEESDKRNQGLIDNLERAGVRKSVQAVREYSHDARPRVADGSVDVLFVDGSHEYEDVLVDIDDWTSALAEGAVVGFNDPFLPGVRRAFRERIARPGSPFRRPRLVVNSVFFDFTRRDPWTASDSMDVMRLRALLKAQRAVSPVLAKARAGEAGPAGRSAAKVIRKILPRLVPSRRG